MLMTCITRFTVSCTPQVTTSEWRLPYNKVTSNNHNQIDELQLDPSLRTEQSSPGPYGALSLITMFRSLPDLDESRSRIHPPLL